MTTAKLFMNGRSQAVRLPREYRFEGQEEVLIKRMGEMVVLIPKGKWEAVYLDGINSFPTDFKMEREQLVDAKEYAL